MNLKKQLPNLITCCNLLSGALAVYMAAWGVFPAALALIVVGAIFDFFDGMVARLLGVSGPLGKELDSLADVVTFGLAPTVMLLSMLLPVLGWWSVIVLPMAAFSAVRLAKFNLDSRQSTGFIGLATPANALFWASTVAALDGAGFLVSPFFAQWTMPVSVVLAGLSWVSCGLLVSEIRFFALKFKHMSWVGNEVRYIFLAGALGIVAAFVIVAVFKGWKYILPAGAVAIVWYVLLAIGMALTTDKTKEDTL